MYTVKYLGHFNPCISNGCIIICFLTTTRGIERQVLIEKEIIILLVGYGTTEACKQLR